RRERADGAAPPRAKPALTRDAARSSNDLALLSCEPEADRAADGERERSGDPAYRAVLERVDAIGEQEHEPVRGVVIGDAIRGATHRSREPARRNARPE